MDKRLSWSLMFNVIQLAVLIAGAVYGFKVLGDFKEDLGDVKEDQKTYQEFMIEQAGLNGQYTMFIEMRMEDGP